MDFLTQQFISTANKLRNTFRELTTKLLSLETKMSDIADGIENLKDSANEHWKANDEKQQIRPSISVADVRTDVPIRVDTKTRKSKPEWGWAILKGALEIAVAVAIIGYTIVAFENWQEQIDATNFAARQTELSRKGLNEVVKNFRVEQRPWIIAYPKFLDLPFFSLRSDGAFSLGFVVDGKNIGKTPAVNVQNAPYEIIVGPKDEAKRRAQRYIPDYSKSFFFVMYPEIEMGNPIHHIEDSHLSADTVAHLRNGDFSMYIVGATRYRDVFTPVMKPYETPYCFIYNSKGQPLASCPFGGSIH